MSTDTLAFIYFGICGITALILWVNMLNIMKEKGHHVNYFWSSPLQIHRFKQIINKEEDKEKRKKYQFIFWGQIALIPIYVIGMLFIILQ